MLKLTMVAHAASRRAAVFCASLVLGWTGPARADDAEAAAPSSSDLHWHEQWQEVGLREYLAIPLLGATYLGLKLWPAAEGARWDSPVLFDGGARKLLRLHSASRRKTAETVSDLLLSAEVLHPVLIDPLLVAWGLHRSPSVAWQMSVINAQAYALTLVLNETVKRLTARQRPFVDACDRDPSGASCASGARYSSFYSGHAAVTATGAGLICAHHSQLELYPQRARQGHLHHGDSRNRRHRRDANPGRQPLGIRRAGRASHGLSVRLSPTDPALLQGTSHCAAGSRSGAATRSGAAHRQRSLSAAPPVRSILTSFDPSSSPHLSVFGLSAASFGRASRSASGARRPLG